MRIFSQALTPNRHRAKTCQPARRYRPCYGLIPLKVRLPQEAVPYQTIDGRVLMQPRSSLTVDVPTAALVRQIAIVQGRGKDISAVVRDMASAYAEGRPELEHLLGPARQQGDMRTSEAFRIKFLELLAARKSAGGALNCEQESEFVAELDRLWWLMTEAEQDEFEEEFGPPGTFVKQCF